MQGQEIQSPIRKRVQRKAALASPLGRPGQSTFLLEQMSGRGQSFATAWVWPTPDAIAITGPNVAAGATPRQGSGFGLIVTS